MEYFLFLLAGFLFGVAVMYLIFVFKIKNSLDKERFKPFDF